MRGSDRSRARSFDPAAIAYMPTLALGWPGASASAAANAADAPSRSRRSNMRESGRDARVHDKLARIDVPAVRRGDLFVEARERAVVIALRRRGSFRAANGTRPPEAACDRPGSAAAPRRQSRLRARRDRSCRAPRTPCTPASAPAQSPASTPACDRPRAAVPRPSCRRRAGNDAASSPARARWRAAPPPGLRRSSRPRTADSRAPPSLRRAIGSSVDACARRVHGARQQVAIGRAAESRALVLQQVCVGQARVRRRISRQLRRRALERRDRVVQLAAHRANRARAAP